MSSSSALTDGVAPARLESAAGADVAPTDTKERLLDAAEHVFAEKGFEGTSMRAVTQAAGAAVSAANYHFGSKRELLRAVLRRRIEPLNRARLERLAELEARLGGRAPDLEDVVEALVRPAFELRASHLGGDGRAFMRHVAARLFADPPPELASLKAELMADVNDRFTAALARALPDVETGGHAVALQLTAGLMVHVLSGQVDPEAAGALPGRESEPWERLCGAVVRYAAAGIRAAADPVMSPLAPSAEDPS